MECSTPAERRCQASSFGVKGSYACALIASEMTVKVEDRETATAAANSPEAKSSRSPTLPPPRAPSREHLWEHSVVAHASPSKQDALLHLQYTKFILPPSCTCPYCQSDVTGNAPSDPSQSAPSVPYIFRASGNTSEVDDVPESWDGASTAEIYAANSKSVLRLGSIHCRWDTSPCTRKSDGVVT